MWNRSPLARQLLQALYGQAASGEVARADVQAHPPDGPPITLACALQPLLDSAGTVRAILSFAVDVSDRQRAQDELQASEARLTEAQRIARVGSWTRDLVADSFTWSDEVYRIFEVDKERAPEFREAFYGTIHPGDRERVSQAYEASVRDWSEYSVRHRLLFPDGREKVVHERGRTEYAEDGTPLRSIGTVQDITEQAAADRALAQSEERYRALFEHASDGIFITDHEDRYVDLNQAGLNLLGYAREELLGRKFSDFIALSPGDLPPQTDALRSGKHMVMQRRMRRADGTEVPVEVSALQLPDGNILASTRDTTERQLSERAMRMLSAQLAPLSGDAFFNEVALGLTQLLNVEAGFVGNLVARSSSRLRTLGLAVDGVIQPPIEFDLAGTPCETVVGTEARVYPERAQQLFPAAQLLRDLGVVSYAAIPLFDRSGRPVGDIGVMSRRPLAYPVRVESILQLFGVRVAAEIERQRTEERFRNVFLNSHDGIVMVSEDGRIIEANPKAAELFRYTRDELLGVSVDRLVPESLQGAHAALRALWADHPIPRMMAPGRPGLQARRKDGSVFFAEIGLSPLPTEDGVVVVATVRDVSERMEAEEERRTLEAELRQAQKMEAIGTFAGGIAHDFNNILAAVMGNAELLAMEIDADDPAQEPIAEIRKASSRARDLVRQILAFSRKQERPKASLELRPAVEEVVQLLRAGLPAGVDLRTEFAADVPGVLADATQIHQVLLNLCTNAWQALEGEPGRIEIRVEGVYLDEQAVRAHGGLSPGLHARLIVRDTGNGMDARVLERVFEPFFTTKGVGGGTGLGLAVVHGIVNAHGGAITVASTPGEGTTFDVYLPAERKADVAPGAGPTAVPRGGGERILYVDDEPSLVIWARRMLEQIGYRVLGVTSFDDAMAALRDPAERFDAMLTDMNMPSGSGLDLIRVARELRPQMPVALISGFATADLHAAAAVLGCSEVLSKPASGAEVAGALRRMLDGDAAPGKS